MKIQDDDARLSAILKYAKKLGIVAKYMTFPNMKQVYKESVLAEDIRKIEQHNDIKRITGIAIVVSIVVAYFGWGWFYNTFVFPPKYKIEAKLYRDYVDLYKINLIVKNIHQGSGEIAKPDLIIYSTDTKKSFTIEPTTKFSGESKKVENGYTITTIDKGKVIKVSGYGLVDEVFEYRVRDKSKYRQSGIKGINDFLKNNKNKLKYKISGYPYGEIEVDLRNEDSQ